MRTLRLSLVGAVILMLLGGPVAVVGQSQEPSDPMAPAGATIEITDFPAFAYGELHTDDAGVLHELGRRVEMIWVSSDPRLSGEVIYIGNRDIFDGDVDRGLAVGTHTYVLVNADGRWIGESPGWQIPDETGLVRAAGDVILFHGEGGCAGLSAIVHTDWSRDPIVSNAVIFPGEMPPVPEPSASPESE